MMFAQQVTNTIPTAYQYVTRPDGVNATDITKCNELPGSYTVASFSQLLTHLVTRLLLILLTLYSGPAAAVR